MTNQLGIHEQAELHELLVFKTNCLTKAEVMQAQADDQQLQQLLQQDMENSRHAIQSLQQIIGQ